MPRPISAGHGPWFADQDVLNLYFGGANNTCLTLPHKLNYSKRFVYWLGAKTYSRIDQLWAVTYKMRNIGNCVRKTPPAIVHYVGGKPWVPIYKKMSWDSHINYLLLERLWWQVFFNDKTIVIASGPSMMRDSIGPYINMFQNVVRINNYDISDQEHFGNKTTHVMVHKGTRPGHFRGVPESNFLFLAFQDRGNLTRLQQRVNRGTKLNLSKVNMVDEWYWTGLNEEVGLEPGKHLLTDTLAVAWAVRNLSPAEPVYVVGFDMLLMNMSSVQQGWASRHANLWNDLRNDQAYLNGLLLQGRIKELKVF